MSISSIVAPIVNTPWPVSALTCGSPARLLVRDYDLVSVLPRPEHVRRGLALRLAHQPEHIHCTQERKWPEYPRLEAWGPNPSDGCLIDHLAVSLYTSSVQYNCREADSRRRSAVPVLPGWYPAIPCPSLWLSAPNQGSNHTSQHQPSLRATAVASLAITTGHCPLLNVEKIILFTP